MDEPGNVEQPQGRDAPSPAEPAGGQILIYRDGSLSLQVRLDGQTVWLTQAGMAELYQTTPQNITLHIKAIYEEGELDEQATCKDYLQVRREGARRVQRMLRHYSLDVILAVGYRVRSARGTQFRQWATSRPRQRAQSPAARGESPPASPQRTQTPVTGFHFRFPIVGM